MSELVPDSIVRYSAHPTNVYFYHAEAINATGYGVIGWDGGVNFVPLAELTPMSESEVMEIINRASVEITSPRWWETMWRGW
jgi:hypothetical protein